MGKLKSIVAVSLLSLYGLIMLHGLIPHSHAKHQDEKSTHIALTQEGNHGHSHSEHNHGHTHDHQKNHEQEKEFSWLDLFYNIVHGLRHIDLGEDHFENYTFHQQNFDFNKSLDILPDVDIKHVSEFTTECCLKPSKSTNFTDPPPSLYCGFIVSAVPDRGPPALV